MKLRFLEIAGVLFVLGFVLGPLCDFFHVAGGTTWYFDPFLFGLAWWVWPLFGFATALIGMTSLASDYYFRHQATRLTWREVAMGLVWFVLIYLVSGFLKPEGVLKIIVLDLMVTWVWYRFDRTSYGVYLGLVVALVGCLAEIGLSQLGVFFYVKPHLFGIAAWLPFVYIAAAIAVANLARKLNEL